MSATGGFSRDGGRFGPARNKPRRGGRAGILALFAVLVSTNLATIGALYFAPEIQGLMTADRSQLYEAYERRIIELRLEVDRLYSRQYAQAGDLNLQLHELTQQQDLLAEQQSVVRMLADQARALGIAPDVAASAPMPASLTTGALPEAAGGVDAIDALNDSIFAMQDEARLALTALSDAATASTSEIVDGLTQLGLSPAAAPSAVGGPFEPAQPGAPAASLADEANAVANALSLYQRARAAIETAPIRQPVAGAQQTTSNFGNRRDPFLGTLAFHAGMDFRAPTGTPVLAAANGVVVSAGRSGGYGNVVDVDHGNGLVTRYAHLSAISVAVGNSIDAGQSVGLAGSTGRSTGPHLHFEVRRNNAAVDPAPYLTVGRRLSDYL